MPKKERLEQIIRQRLLAGRAKKEILADLAASFDPDEVTFYLNQLPTKKKRRQWRWINVLLCLLLLAVTLKKLFFMASLQLTAVSVGQFSPLLLLDLIVPMINFYVLYKLLRFHRQGYQFMAILGVLALIRPENRILPDGPVYLVIIALSLLLLFQLFPKKNQL